MLFVVRSVAGGKFEINISSNVCVLWHFKLWNMIWSFDKIFIVNIIVKWVPLFRISSHHSSPLAYISTDIDSFVVVFIHVSRFLMLLLLFTGQSSSHLFCSHSLAVVTTIRLLLQFNTQPHNQLCLHNRKTTTISAAAAWITIASIIKHHVVG